MAMALAAGLLLLCPAGNAQTAQALPEIDTYVKLVSRRSSHRPGEANAGGWRSHPSRDRAQSGFLSQAAGEVARSCPGFDRDDSKSRLMILTIGYRYLPQANGAPGTNRLEPLLTLNFPDERRLPAHRHPQSCRHRLAGRHVHLALSQPVSGRTNVSHSLLPSRSVCQLGVLFTRTYIVSGPTQRCMRVSSSRFRRHFELDPYYDEHQNNTRSESQSSVGPAGRYHPGCSSSRCRPGCSATKRCALGPEPGRAAASAGIVASDAGELAFFATRSPNQGSERIVFSSGVVAEGESSTYAEPAERAERYGAAGNVAGPVRAGIHVRLACENRGVPRWSARRSDPHHGVQALAGRAEVMVLSVDSTGSAILFWMAALCLFTLFFHREPLVRSVFATPPPQFFSAICAALPPSSACPRLASSRIFLRSYPGVRSF